MAIPDYQSLMLPLLELAGDDQVHRVHDAVDLLARQFKLTAEETREVIPSGRVSRFHNNVTWARTYLEEGWSSGGSEARGVSHHGPRSSGSRGRAQEHRREVSRAIR